MLRRQLGLPTIGSTSFSDVVKKLHRTHELTGLHALKDSWIDCGFKAFESDEMTRLLEDVIRLLETENSDVLGNVYEELVPQEERRKLGEFYTPRPIAEFMVRWAVNSSKDYVLDPGVGSGTFLVETLYKLEELGVPRFQAVSQLYGVDLNPLAVLMATINVMRHAPNSRPHIYLADFFDITPQTAETLGRTEFDAVICNPPYTRHHELRAEYKEKIAKLVEEEGGIKVSRLSSLYLYFFIHSFSFLRDGGRAAFITPSEWMEAAYGKALRKFLAQRASIEAIILFDERELAFPRVLTRACITLAIKGGRTERPLLVMLKRWPSVRELLEAIQKKKLGDLGWGRASLVSFDMLNPSSKWTSLFEPAGVTSPPALMMKLGELAKISRGIATGANEFFTLSEEEAKKYDIEHEFLRPVVVSARLLVKHLRGYVLRKEDWNLMRAKGEKIYLLWCFKRKEKLVGTNVLKYIKEGERKGYNKRYLTCHRSIWYGVEQRQPPDALLFYMFRRGLRAILNEFGTLALNTLHCIYFRENIREDPIKVKAILAYLNSDLAMELANEALRVYGGGMYKLEPRDAESIPVPNPAKLRRVQLEELASLFDELDEAAREGKSRETEVRAILDSTLRRIL